MGTAERRLEILKFLCRVRSAKMPQLAELFGVSVRTIQRDIFEIEATFHAPLNVKYGKYDGGVYVIGDYTFDRIYMCEEELLLFKKIQALVREQLSDEENYMLSQTIKNYTKSA